MNLGKQDEQKTQKKKLADNMNSEKKMEINKPYQSKLEFIQPCKALNSSVGLKSLLKVNTSIGNRTQSRKTLQSILQANKSTQGPSQNNSNNTNPLNGLQKNRSSQNVQIPLDSRNIQEGIFSVCVESSKGSPNIQIIQPGVEEKLGQNKVNFDLQSHPDELSIRHKLRRNKKHISELNAKVEVKDNYSSEEESNESEDGKKEKSSDDEIFLKDKLSGNEIHEKYLSFVKHYINGEFEYKGTRKLNCKPAKHDHQSVCPCIVCGDQAVGMYFGIMVCYSCRTFIVATVQHRSILKCDAQSNCTIYFRKEICTHCRFKKCLWAGAVVAEVPLRLQKLSQFKQTLTVKRKKQSKRTSKRIKERLCGKPATATRCAPTMYFTSDLDVDTSCDNKNDCGKPAAATKCASTMHFTCDIDVNTDCQNKDECDKLVDSSYPIKSSGGQKNYRKSEELTLCSGFKETCGTEIPLKPLSEKNNMEENFHYFKQNSGPLSTSDILTDWQRLHKSVQEQFQKLKN
ncbi:NR6AN [Mytilus coruscus]|uniref:NR6AN n=1 Tax=Mytilus coruscus TaxID=42192 RepID=A0A6J7ZV23_MYTCO|nr:NR6AN [Mytilus coruscus]